MSLPPVEDVLRASGGWAIVLGSSDVPAQRTVPGELVERVVAVRLGRAGHGVEVTCTPVGDALERVAYAMATRQRVAVSTLVHPEGPAHDQPIVVALPLASEQGPVPPEPPCYLGELSLDGPLRYTNGIIPMVSFAPERSFPNALVPLPDAREAALVEGPEVQPVASLSQLVGHLCGETPIPTYLPPADLELADPEFPIDMSHIRGQ